VYFISSWGLSFPTASSLLHQALRSAVMETRLWAEEVRLRSWQLCAESRRQRLARWMAGANPLTVAVTAWIITQCQLW